MKEARKERSEMMTERQAGSRSRGVLEAGVRCFQFLLKIPEERKIFPGRRAAFLPGVPGLAETSLNTASSTPCRQASLPGSPLAFCSPVQTPPQLTLPQEAPHPHQLQPVGTPLADHP